MEVTEFARMGGKAVLAKHGRKHFSELGKKSAQAKKDKKNAQINTEASSPTTE